MQLHSFYELSDSKKNVELSEEALKVSKLKLSVAKKTVQFVDGLIQEEYDIFKDFVRPFFTSLTQ